MDLRQLDDWIAYVKRARQAGQRSSIDGGGWAVSMSTPPPIKEDPMARIPLERARRICERIANEEDLVVRQQLRQEALEWLGHLHPNTTATLHKLIEQERQSLLAAK